MSGTYVCVASTNAERVDADSLIAIRWERSWFEWNRQIVFRERNLNCLLAQLRGIS
jgi:hypothetical protein